MLGRFAPLWLALVLGCGAATPPRPASSTATTPPPTTSAESAPPSVNPQINARYGSPEGRALSVQVFESPERASYQMPDEVLANLKIKPGEAVADVAAGTGYMVTRLSAAVGPKGKVFEQDIQKEFLDLVRDKIAQNKLANVEVVLGEPRDVKLPAGCCDLIFVLDAYHHFEWPGDMLASIAKAMKPNGRLVLVDFHKRPNDVFTKYKIDYQQHLRLDYDGVVKELDQYGWKHVETKNFLPFQFFSVFTLKPR